MQGHKGGDLGERGFSLIEVMLAIILLVVGLVSLAQMIVVATNSNALSGRVTSSAALAKEQLELLKAAPYYVSVAAKQINPLLTPGGDIDNPTAGYVQYYDADGQALPGAAGALYEVLWQIQQIRPPGSGPPLPLSMMQITVRGRTAQRGTAFEFIGDSTFVTFRTANVD